jgi:tRNA nucleotidyltransferase (CCA-adding enzyme)
MNITLPKQILEIFNIFEKANYQLYLVGGSVRDLLMKREIHDWDFTTDAQPEQILKLFPKGFNNNKFGTVGIQLSAISHQLSDEETKKSLTANSAASLKADDSIVEITTMRKEGDYKDHRHPSKVGWTNKIEEDLKRRDFTINAIALSRASASLSQEFSLSEPEASRSVTIIDPFNGQVDLQNKTIRAVGDPDKRFQEDALRLMRAIRFATQLNFQIEEQTFAAIKANAELIKEIAWERIRDELFKILSSENPYQGIIMLREVGLLKFILPELEDCFGIQQQGPKHDREYDIGTHCLLALKETPSKDPLVRLATLLHDIGKKETMAITPDGNVTFYNHEVVGAHQTLKIAKRFNLSKAQSDKLFKLIRWHMFTLDENQTDSAIRRFIKNVGFENVKDMMDLRIGDRLGGGTQKAISWRMEKFSERIDEVMQKPFSISDLKITGIDVMETLNIPTGPQVGQILQKLFEEVLEDAEKNNKDYLLKRIPELN